VSTPQTHPVGPWDLFEGITKPMFVVLYDAALYGRERISRGLYHPGQTRLIMSGLYARELIERDGTLTPAGQALALRVRAAVADYWPGGRPDPEPPAERHTEPGEGTA